MRPTSTNKGNTETKGGWRIVSINSKHRVGSSRKEKKMIKDILRKKSFISYQRILNNL